MTTMKLTRVARALAAVLPAGAMLLALPALAAAPSIPEAPASIFGSDLATTSRLLRFDGPAGAGHFPGNTAPHIRLAGKLSKAITGAAAGSRAAHASSKPEEQRASGNDQEAGKDTESEKSRPEAESPPGGPFKVEIPGQHGNQNAAENSAPASTPVTASQNEPRSAATPPTAAAAPAVVSVDKAEKSAATPGPQSPVRTLLDRSAKDSASGMSTGQAAAGSNEIKRAATAASAKPLTSAPASTDATDAGCVAGCYAPTSTQLTSPAGRRAASTQPSGSMHKTAPVAQTGLQTGIECLAGCDGVDGKPLPRATSGAADAPAGQTAAATSQNGTNRVVIMRGNSRTKTYGVNQ